MFVSWSERGGGDVTDSERTEIVLAIHALKARYFRTMDTKDWPGMKSVFAADLVADFRESVGGWDEALLVHGAVSFVAKLAAQLEHVTTVHHGHMPEITVESPDAASGIW